MVYDVYTFAQNVSIYIAVNNIFFKLLCRSEGIFVKKIFSDMKQPYISRKTHFHIFVLM